ncbi:aldehyde dehydrogenase [Methyloceanibacter marginalis]|uniref:Aldehyde dehydrogenase n=1 Tax=Methyloceanibacter marginalis TaxID=1774971 RepID=A0A1E3WDA1_9HYPH|nr:aldehyde dehydrogenase family protein [Methyloceanibacter marginalis]ODS03047.1 aldehyde dehydrogenase [Methyloceanibacter marginalis]
MSESLKVISPIDGSVYAERPIESAAAIDAALSAARAALPQWKATPVAERSRYMLAFLDALLATNDDMTVELAWQMGRPVRYGGEKGGIEERTRAVVALAEQALKPYYPPEKDGFRRYITREPLGIVLALAPWNYPYLTAVNAIVPALLAGNSVILKHAAQTLLVGERFAEAFKRAGLPKGLFQNLVMSHAQTETLIGSGRVDHINFTGSVAGGRTIERAAGGTFASLGLELGGKDPAYVRADAKLDHAIENLVDGSFFNSGQSCCGVERIYVDARIFDDFVEGFADLTRKYVVGNPLEQATTLGPMVRGAAADAVRSQIDEAKRKGATALINMKVEGDRSGSPYLAPEVLIGVNHQMEVMREESFGPVVGIMKVRDDEEAVTLMNDSPYGLTASIWTRDMDRAAELGNQIETGTVFMNRCDYLDPYLAWTGVKDTGRGVSLSKYGFEALTQPKSFHLREV